ncbi:DUF7503 family protein [Halorussus ruber]
MPQKSDITDWLASHPKMMGAVWTLMVVAVEAGSLIDTSSIGSAGP